MKILKKRVEVRGLALFLFLHLSFLHFSRFIIFTFWNYFTKPSSAAGRSWHQSTSAADISQHQQLKSAADDDFVICRNVRADKCSCCQADVWCVLCIWIKITFYCHHHFMKKAILSCLKMNLKISHNLVCL